MKKLIHSIIGCGSVGPTHIKAFQSLENVEIKWICDLDVKKIDSAATEFKIPKKSLNYRDILKDKKVDSVSICVDHNLHYPIAIAALKAGKHVLVEKPLAHRIEHAQEIIETARKKGLVLGSVFQHRFDPIASRVRDYVNQGIFGKIIHASASLRCFKPESYYIGHPWRGRWEKEGGSVLINQAIHSIDLLVWTLGRVDKITGTIKQNKFKGIIETEDTASAHIVFKNGALGAIQATNSYHSGWETEIGLFGDKGSIIYDSGFPSYVKHIGFGETNEKTTQISQELKSLANDNETPLGKNHYGPSHPRLCANFAKHILDGEPLVVTGEEALGTLEVILGIYESASKKHTIKLPLKKYQIPFGFFGK